MTHEDTTFHFRKNKCIMIFGKNLTDSGTDSNGGGKSTILEGFTLAITGLTNREVPKEDFINDNADECYIELHLTNELGLVNDLVIKRWFHRKKSAKIELWENGALNDEMTSVAEANSRVFDLIGLNKDDLTHFFIVGQETSYSFLTAGDADRKDIITRFSDIEFINVKVEELKLKRKTANDKLDSVEKRYQKVENKLEFLAERKNNVKNNFEKDREQQLEDLEEKITVQGKKKKNNEKEQTELSSEIKKLKDKALKIKYEDVAELKTSKKTAERKVSEKEKEIKAIEHTIQDLDNIQEGGVTCPSCEFIFNPSEDIDLADIPELIEQANSLLLEKQGELKKLNKKVEILETKIETNEDLKEQIDELNRKVKRKENDLKILKDTFSSYDKKIKNYKSEIETVKASSSASEIKTINAEIKEQSTALTTIKDEKDALDAEILEYDYWIFHFGNKGFKTFLTNKSIKSIEGITNSYLKRMNSELQLLMEGFTVLKSGDVREKMNVSIVRGGTSIANFKRYSGGEKGRIKLANIIGLQHLINLTAKNGGLNFLGLDEVFEGLDRTGQIDVLNILENLKITSIVITHRNQPIGAENEIFIEKINGISRII